jgi:hypothetical protein
VLGKAGRQIGLGKYGTDLRPIHQANVLLVAAEVHVPDLAQQRRLVPERRVDRLDGDAGRRRDLRDRGPPVPLGDEELVGGADDVQPRLAGLLLSAS